MIFDLDKGLDEVVNVIMDVRDRERGGSRGIYT